MRLVIVLVLVLFLLTGCAAWQAFIAGAATGGAAIAGLAGGVADEAEAQEEGRTYMPPANASPQKKIGYIIGATALLGIAVFSGKRKQK
ncbi:hypothetical protein CMI37_36935 [Candidatus Pacearchaeota archaeon]|nr:hypothetical protein [Candidatus Pacearchaeota archaeon]|tara:strand:+ start:1798 stop:2064 length:267 start_codon:yes stop_codon:yes gene_type:complete